MNPRVKHKIMFNKDKIEILVGTKQNRVIDMREFGAKGQNTGSRTQKKSSELKS